MNIRQITIQRCLEEQYHAAECFHRASTWLQFTGKVRETSLRAAVREQLIGAAHSERARSRLDRINGVDAIVEVRAS